MDALFLEPAIMSEKIIIRVVLHGEYQLQICHQRIRKKR